MSFKKRIIFFVVGIGLSLLTYSLVFAEQANAQTPAENERILAAVKDWVVGRYDSSEQYQRDIDTGASDTQQHRLMYQLFAPIDASFADGVLVYQQSSMDGSEDPDWITRRGLLQFYVNSETGQVHQRELDFKDSENVFNVHRDPEFLAGLTLEDFTWRENCDFKLTMSEDGLSVSGPMDFGPCRMEMPSGGVMTADDKIHITPDEFWFLGRYLDEDGAVVWGTESDEMNKLKRVGDIDESSAVLVFGGTRNTGLEIIKILAARGDSVTAFVRPTSDVSALNDLGVTLFEGDALDADSVRAAFDAESYGAVISSLGSTRGDSPVDDVGTINVAEAAKATGVDRILMVSSIGAGESKGALPFYVRWILGSALERKTTAENHLMASGLDYTIIRPGGLGEGPASETGQLIEGSEIFAFGQISRAEVARLLVEAFDDPDTERKVYHAIEAAD
ncbi:MAG: NAD(P)H-binding protein [Rhodospirillaceae bacterium]|nr:NAD(P)H-binding protein [Rhodospirillaceae bacterium]MBT5240432.1 NAD(P)H-binding protein [Rhodospirillaceae bacterium]MBT5566700.1 NAD(P)H-binding protein [Rhodospirillaceae bacterium]MBT6090751.1 NAD(P)H-binding protein [Rhodospirillaceae bacterium]